MPLECAPLDGAGDGRLRAVTSNVSTGGVYFEADLADAADLPAERSLVEVQLTVPPGDGYFPYRGRINAVAEVVRCDMLSALAGAADGRRVGIAARFCEPLRLMF